MPRAKNYINIDNSHSFYSKSQRCGVLQVYKACCTNVENELNKCVT